MNRIFYFSGTDNTKLLSEYMVKTFIEKGEQADCVAIDQLKKNGQEATNDFTRMGIGFPVHAFSMPNLMLDFIKGLPQGKGREAFVFHTASKQIPINLPGLIRARKLLEMKGYKVIYQRPFAMGCNYYVEYSDLLVKQLYTVNLEKIQFMIEEILSGKTRYVQLNPVVSELLYLAHGMEEGGGAKVFGACLKTNADCTLCMTCVKNCPVDNIKVTDGRITFGNHCMWCMKCMYQCPVDCIEPGVSKKVKLENGYDVKKIIQNQEIDIRDYQLEEAYSKAFRDYFSEVWK